MLVPVGRAGAQRSDVRPPTAAELANKKASISGWRVLGANESAMAGDIAAYKIPGGGVGGVGGTGHTGFIVSGIGGQLGNLSAHLNTIHEVPGQLELGGTTYRRYTGE